MKRLLLLAPAAAGVLALMLGVGPSRAQQSDEGAEPAATTGASQGMMQGAGSGMHGPGMMPGGSMPGAGMMRGGGMPPRMMMTMMFVMMDTDGSGSLSLEEVMAPHERMFGYVDADGDGEITRDEMQGFMMSMHGLN